MARQRQLKSAPNDFDGSKFVAICTKSREGILKGKRDQGAVSLKRTLPTFFREKVGAHRAGENCKFAKYSEQAVKLRKSYDG